MMRVAKLSFLFVLVIGTACAGRPSLQGGQVSNPHRATSVSLGQLLEVHQPVGQVIVVSGYVSLDFEGQAIYSHHEDCLNSDGPSLWIELQSGIKPRNWRRCDFAEITGIYDPKETGHFGMWPLGGLISVSQVRGVNENP